jgi:hypothetical protein
MTVAREYSPRHSEPDVAAVRHPTSVRTFVDRLRGAKSDERAWRAAADADADIALGRRLLARLGPQWHVVHGIAVDDRGTRIHHLVIGPSGVFAINTGREATARDAKYEADHAARVLSGWVHRIVEVHGMVAVLGAHRDEVEPPNPDPVVVVARARIDHHLRALPTVLDLATVEQIYQAARQLAV